MRILSALLMAGACLAASGCAATMTSLATLNETMRARGTSEITDPAAPDPSDLPSIASDIENENIADGVVRDEPPGSNLIGTEADSPDAIGEDRQGEVESAAETETAEADQPRQHAFEEVIRPEPWARGPFKSGQGEAADVDRFARSLSESPLDIRPTAGAMPEDLAKPVFAAALSPDRRESDERPPLMCAWSPWTLCYRPLYFEEIPLERYGMTYGLVQPVASGAHFFGSVAALPYKMAVRPPRSCQCSNGFSSIGDIPPPNYGKRELRLDAGLVEAGVIAGIIFILP